MVARGTPFCGVLFVGLMLTPDGPKVLEYNVRFGDPECQVLMARLKSPLAPLLSSLLARQPSQAQWYSRSAMTVVLAAEGYPGLYAKGAPISVPQVEDSAGFGTASNHLIHAGTALVDGKLVTNGGRVMNAVGAGETLQEARDAAYSLAEEVTWPGRFYRRDIGWRAL